MKRCVLLIIVLILCSVPAFAQLSIVQTTPGGTQAGVWPSLTATTGAFSSALTSNNYLVSVSQACIQNDCSVAGASGNLVGSDTLGLAMQRCAVLTASPRAYQASIWIAKITTSATDAITSQCVGCGNAAFGGATGFELSGTGITGTSGLCDVVGVTKGTVSGGVASVSTSSATTASGRLLVANVIGGCSAGPPTGYTSMSTPISGNLGMKIAGAAQVETATWTGCANGAEYEAFIVAMGNSSAPPPCTGSSPNLTLADPNNMQACHDNVAVNGDTITQAAGTFHVTTGATISKNVKVTAAAGGVTIIDDSCAGSCFTTAQSMWILSESSDGDIDLSGFTFQMGTAVHSNPSGVLYMNATGGKPIRIHGNSYTTKQTSGDFIIAATNQGVIDNNSMTGDWLDSPQCFNNSSFVRHKVSAAGVAGWQVVPKYGAADATGNYHLTIENNTVTNVLEGIDTDDDGRTTLRFNTLTNVAVILHGTDTSGLLGARLNEMYGNNFVHDLTPAAPGTACNNSNGAVPINSNGSIGIRGGSVLIHHNIIPDGSSAAWGSKSAVTFLLENLNRNSGGFPCYGTLTDPPGTYPAPHQPGWGWNGGGTSINVPAASQPPSTITQDVEPMYLWANSGAGNYNAPSIQPFSPDQCSGFGTPPPIANFFFEGSNYFLNADAPSGLPGYSPFTCPHPLTGLTGTCNLSTPGTSGYNVGGGNTMAFTQQPTNLASGGTFSPTIAGSLTSTSVDSITLSSLTGTCNPTGSLTVSSTGGSPNTFSFSGVGANGTPQLNCGWKITDNTDVTVTPVNSTAFNMTGTLTFSTQPTNANSGVAFSPTVVATVNPTASDALKITLLNCPNNALGGTTTVTASGGHSTYTGVDPTGALASGCALSVSDTTNTSGAIPNATSSTFNITCLPNKLGFIGQPGSVLTGQILGTVSVGVYDAANNLCATDTSTTITIANKAATCSGMTLVGTSSGSDTAGVFSTNTLAETVGSGGCTLHATASGLTSADSNAFTITAVTPPGKAGKTRIKHH